MQIVASMQQIQVLLFETFWNFFPNIFDPQLVEYGDGTGNLRICRLTVYSWSCDKYILGKERASNLLKNTQQGKHPKCNMLTLNASFSHSFPGPLVQGI